VFSLEEKHLVFSKRDTIRWLLANETRRFRMINKDDVCLMRKFHPFMTLEAMGKRFNVSRERIR